MASRTIYICDNCKAESEDSNDRKQWRTIKIENTDYSNNFYKNLLLCENCCEKLGIPKIKEPTQEQTLSIENRLYDIVCEIIQGNMQGG